jgi:hypothetical protein
MDKRIADEMESLKSGMFEKVSLTQGSGRAFVLDKTLFKAHSAVPLDWWPCGLMLKGSWQHQEAAGSLDWQRRLDRSRVV